MFTNGNLKTYPVIKIKWSITNFGTYLYMFIHIYVYIYRLTTHVY